MTFTISDALFHVFGLGSKEGVASFEGRRWFRRPELPGDHQKSEKDKADARYFADIVKAENLLSSSIEAAARNWPDAEEVSLGFDPQMHLPPRTPYDVFAIAAYLVEHAGIYHHVQPAKRPHPEATDRARSDVRHLPITANDRDLVRKTADAWRGLDVNKSSMLDFASALVRGPVWQDLEPLFESWWVVFRCCGNRDLHERPISIDGKPEVPKWWMHAWRLLAIADEAARGTCFNFDIEDIETFVTGESSGDGSVVAGRANGVVWFEGEVMMEIVGAAIRKYAVDPKGGERSFSEISTISVAKSTVVNVLPKVRTPSIGCTLRSISHHLALLPPQSVVRGRWTPNYTQRTASAGDLPRDVMNLVLVPIPFSVNARTFRPVEIEDVSEAGVGAVARIGYFDVAQDWLVQDQKFEDFVRALIKSACSGSADIHGLVFPELALNYDLFVRVRDIMLECLPSAELLIAGVSTNEDGCHGNFVATSSFKRGRSGSPVTRETVREKHHRWKLDSSQLRDYGLLGALSPELDWWESINLNSRLVDFTALRNDSVFAALICEDLARVDPCQQILRAVGPNLVVALLMDAPQIEARWPARYATVLAEDPGCAVLTLTSRGLMTLQHRTGTFGSSGNDRTIALWRNDGASRPVTINCPYDAQAVVLTIRAGKAHDVSLDGRIDEHAKAWRYAGHLPVRVPDARRDFPNVLGSEDMACW